VSSSIALKLQSILKIKLGHEAKAGIPKKKSRLVEIYRKS
jgi:hypothetical protein